MEVQETSTKNEAQDVKNIEQNGIVDKDNEQGDIIAINKNREKLRGYEFYKSLGSPKLVLGPMVDASELPFRMMCRKYATELCYTPMLHSVNFLRDPKYRAKFFTTHANDRPLIVQFCGNDPETLLKAAQYVEDHCDGVDINLGCPQGIAKRGYYGSFLMENIELIESLVSILHQNLKVPVCCKIRVFDDEEKTIHYAKRIEAAGCQLLTVHGRTRNNKGRESTPADWKIISKVKQSVSIPVIANGSVESFEDVQRCLSISNADGVMSAYPHLLNPRMFKQGETGTDPLTRIEMAKEYLEFCKEFKVTKKMMRGHLFKLVQKELLEWKDCYERVGSADTIEEAGAILDLLEERVKQKTGAVGKETKNPVKDMQSHEEDCGELDFAMFGSKDEDEM
eukprot:TRINITY_DN19172_c0_g1_i1.p1 TRINITY_DN19172_c0_g1~~TRINITY_DN19172_c0_g1_i1.p1  ORF type:complete len:395 (-),score=74.07 TRINITY_DN19172_c0_g1_i1:21-1205(-)